MVAAAAGIDATRGDEVNVELVSFTKADVSQAAAALDEARAQEQQSSITQIVTAAVPFAGVALILVILLSGIRLSRKRRQGAKDAKDIGEMVQARDAVEQADPRVLPAGLSDTVAFPAPAAPPLVPAGFGEAEYTANQVEVGIDRMRMDIDRLAAASPERTAEYLRSLMDDRSLA
jgi:flagellar M-ring protein FliF